MPRLLYLRLPYSIAAHLNTMRNTMQAYLGGIEGQALDGLQKGLDGVIAGGDQHASVHLDDRPLTEHTCCT